MSKISLDHCKSDYVQVDDVLINNINNRQTIKCDWSQLGDIMNVVLSISTECDLELNNNIPNPLKWNRFPQIFMN